MKLKHVLDIYETHIQYCLNNEETKKHPEELLLTRSQIERMMKEAHREVEVRIMRDQRQNLKRRA